MIPVADLHCHSLFSDGTHSPLEIAQKAKEMNFTAVVLTDHDTIEGSCLLEPIAREMGLAFLHGVEFSSRFEEEPIHILGYGFQPNSPAIQALCERHGHRREKRNRAILQKLSTFGIDIHYETMVNDCSGVVGRPHIARQLILKGVVSTMEEAFSIWLAEGKKGYVPEDSPTVTETIDTIHKASGIAILAHPQLIKNRPLLRKLLQLPFDGIEAWYGTFGREKAAPFLSLAKERGWIVTGGSDFHGNTKPNSIYGSSYTDEENFRRLQRNP